MRLTGSHSKADCRRVWRQEWKPAVFDPADVVRIKAILAAAAFIRGLNYLYAGVEPDHVTTLDTGVPIHVWAVLCFTIAASLIVGMVWRRHILVWSGHMLGAVTYAAITAATAQAAFDSIPPDDWRRVMPLALITFCHATLALRSGKTPITAGESVTVERMVAPKQ